MDENEKKMDVNELIEKEKKGSLGSGEFDDSLDDLDYDIDKMDKVYDAASRQAARYQARRSTK